MPFKSTPIGFNSFGVGSFAPSQAGVYGLFRHGQWVYIGQSSNIKDTMLEYLRSSVNPCMDNETPTHFICEIVLEGEQERLQREKVLIAELKPKCNAVDQISDQSNEFGSLQ